MHEITCIAAKRGLRTNIGIPFPRYALTPYALSYYESITVPDRSFPTSFHAGNSSNRFYMPLHMTDLKKIQLVVYSTDITPVLQIAGQKYKRYFEVFLEYFTACQNL
jgi:hypothetical protein